MEFLKQKFSKAYEKFVTNADWMLIFVTYGDTRIDSKHSNKTDDSAIVEPIDGSYPKKYNGLIASMDVLVALATVALTVSITPYLADDLSQATNRVPEIILLVFMVVGLSTLFAFTNKKDAFVARNNFGRRVQNFKNLDRILLMVGLVLFYTLSFVLDIFHCIAQIDCRNEWVALNDSNAMIDYIVDILFHLVRAIYLSCSTLFVVIYGHAILSDKCWIRYGLVILFGCNLAIWFDVLLHEAGSGFIGNKYPNNTHINCSNESYFGEILGNKTVDCLCFNTSFFKVLKKDVSPICYPFMYECSVLLGERFMHWFCSCSPKTENLKKMSKRMLCDAPNSVRHQTCEEFQSSENQLNTSIQSLVTSGELVHIPSSEDTASLSADEGSSDEGMFESEDIYDLYYSDDSLQEDPHLAEDPTIDIDGNQILLANDSTLAVQGQTFQNIRENKTCLKCKNACRCDDSIKQRTNNDFPERSLQSSFEDPPLQDKPATMIMCSLFFLFTISTNVLFLILAFMPLLIKENSGNVKIVFLYYSTVYYCLVLLVIVVGFVVARDFPLRRSRSIFQGLDYLLLISACGPFAFNLLSLVVIIFQPGVLDKHSLKLGPSLLLQFSNLLEVYVQIPFCFFSGRVMALNSNGTRRPRAKYFQAVLIYLAVSNAILWIVNSFATTYNGKNVYYASDFFKEVWEIINSCVLPLTLFFRFNSSLLLLKALRKAFSKPQLRRISFRHVSH